MTFTHEELIVIETMAEQALEDFERHPDRFGPSLASAIAATQHIISKIEMELRP